MSRQCAVAMCQATCTGFAAIPRVKFALALCGTATFVGSAGQTLVRPQCVTPSAARIKKDGPCFEFWCDTMIFCGGISTHVSADMGSLVFGCGRFCPWVILCASGACCELHSAHVRSEAGSGWWLMPLSPTHTLQVSTSVMGNVAVTPAGQFQRPQDLADDSA